MTYLEERAELFMKLASQAGVDPFEASNEELRVIYDKVFGDNKKHWGALQYNIRRMREARKVAQERELECMICGGPLPMPSSKFSTCARCRAVHIVRA
jgi:hypothetical protein